MEWYEEKKRLVNEYYTQSMKNVSEFSLRTRYEGIVFIERISFEWMAMREKASTDITFLVKNKWCVPEKKYTFMSYFNWSIYLHTHKDIRGVRDVN